MAAENRDLKTQKLFTVVFLLYAVPLTLLTGADRLAQHMAGRLRGNSLKRTIKPWPSAEPPSGAT